MTWEYDPEWTKDYKLPQLSDLSCPICGKIPGHAQEFLNQLVGKGDDPTYAVRHIPPAIVLTCDNEDCPACDYDYEAFLKMTITVTGKGPITHWGEPVEL